MPTDLAAIPAAQRRRRAWWNQEYCIIDRERCYAYGSLSLQISGHDDHVIWGVWAKVSGEDYNIIRELHTAVGRERHAPVAAALATDIPFYAVPTLGLPASITLQSVGTRPEIVLLSGSHALIQEQAQGITIQRRHEILSWFQGRR